MNTEKAQGILRKQIVKLDQENFNPTIWSIQTRKYLSVFFGSESEEYLFLHIHFWNVGSKASGDSTIESKKINASNFLNNCIDTIGDLGLYKPETTGNFITRMPDGWAITIIIALLGFAGWLGNLSYPYLNP